MTRNNSQYLISLGRWKSISRELGKTLYRAVYMTKKLQEHFGEKIVIITVNNRNVMTFCSTVATIISEFYKQPKVDDYEVEQTRIVAVLKKVWIRYDIRDSARRSQQGLHLYSRNVSPLLLQPLSTTASGLPPGTAVERCCDPATRRGVLFVFKIASLTSFGITNSLQFLSQKRG